MKEDLIKSIQISDVAEAEEILKSAGSEDLFEKARQVGEAHPNGKWVWTEYAPGKFDWRGIKKKNGGNSSKTTKTDNQPKKSSTDKLDSHVSKLPTSALKNAIEDKNTPKEFRDAAKRELENRSKTDTTEQPITNKQEDSAKPKQGDGKVKIDDNKQKKQSGKKFNFNEALKKAKEIEVNPNLFNDLGKSSLMSRMFKVFDLDNKVKVTKEGFGPYKMNFFVDGEKKQGYTIYSRDGTIGSADFADCVCDCIIEELEKKKVKFDKDKINAWIFDLK